MGTKEGRGDALMKILYIGHLREGTGWSKAANNNILSLINSGQDLVCKSIDLTTNSNKKLDDKIEECLTKNVEDIDICIQHVLPHHLVATDLFKKNIAFFEAETSTIKHLSWYYNLEMMDAVWVPCKHNRDVLVRDGISKEKVKIVPHTFDIQKYNNDKAYEISVGTPGFFKFYTISDLNDRKNLDSIIRCFHSEFRSHEPVELVLKVHSNTMDTQSVRSVITEKSVHIKNQLRIYPSYELYKNEIIITEYLTEEHMDMLHKSCDCFISPSHGEGFSIPAFEAMLYGKTPICSNDGGPKDFINPDDKNTGTLIDGTYDVCNTTNAAFAEINTGLEEWFHPSESEIKKTMRYYYDNKGKIDQSAGKKQGESFDNKIISKKILELINE